MAAGYLPPRALAGSLASVARETHGGLSRAGTVVLADPDLTFLVAAGDRWTGTIQLLYMAATDSDLRTQILTPAGSSGAVGVTGIQQAGASINAVKSEGAAVAPFTVDCGGLGAALLLAATLHFDVVVGDAGSIALGWCSRTVGATPAILVSGMLTAIRMAA